MATSQRAKELAHQVDYLTKVIDELSDENNRLMKVNRNQVDDNVYAWNKIKLLRKHITDNIEKGNQ